VNVEQASKWATWEPTRPENGEGRRRWGIERRVPSGPTGVVTMACLEEETAGNTGSPGGAAA
jgi:hypothetical protein